jgi:hypothetical protein
MVMQKAGAKTQGISPGSQTPEAKPWKPNPGSQNPDDKTREPKPGRWIADREVPGLRKPGNL